MTTILAIDCATGPCSVAVWDGSTVVAYVENLKPIMQSASLIPMVEDALRQGGMGYKDIHCVAATVGPGSFTGIRVGLAAAQGIAYASGIRGQGYTTLDVLAFSARPHDHALAVLQAGKGECYYQAFHKGMPVYKPRVGLLEQALQEQVNQPVYVAGNIPVSAEGFEQGMVTFPRADILAELAASSAAYVEFKPFYIRAPDAKLPTKICG